MSGAANPALLLGASLSALAAALHLAIIVGGAPWYRCFGAGEGMAKLAQAGHWWPALLTLGIAFVLLVAAAYALGAGGWSAALRGLPGLRWVLLGITTVYLLRGLAPWPAMLLQPELRQPFWIWSTLICAGYGGVHALGLARVWSRL